MRWDNLFDDLEGQLEHGLNAEEFDARAEEERLRLGRLSMRERLVALAGPGSHGSSPLLRAVLVSGETIVVRPSAFGRDWLAADLVEVRSTGAQCVLPLAAIAAVVLAQPDVERSLAAAPGRTTRMVDRIGLAFVLRDLSRRRRSLELRTMAGPVWGTLDRVGRDHLDLAVHPPGTLRRDREVQHYRMVPFAQITVVRLE